MRKKFVITEEEKKEIKSLYNLTEQAENIVNTIIQKAKEYAQNKLKSTSTSDLSTNTTTSDDDFYKNILKCIGAEPTRNNMLFMYAWRQAENTVASNNPFGSTQPWAGATVLKNSTAGVKNYKTPEDGVQATCQILKNGKYQQVIDGFKNDVGLTKLTDAVVSSPWGTKDLLRTVTKDYLAGVSPKPHPINKTEIA
jgi:hypothetical protein